MELVSLKPLRLLTFSFHLHSEKQALRAADTQYTSLMSVL